MLLCFSPPQLDSKAQGELKEGMKIYTSDEGLKNSWDNVQKMVRMDPIVRLNTEDPRPSHSGILPTPQTVQWFISRP